MKIIPWDASRLAEVVELWNKELGEEYPMRPKLFNQNSLEDKNVLEDGCAMAVDDQNKIIGFSVAKKWQEKVDVKMDSKRGWVQVLLVDTNYRNKGLGTRLLNKVEETLKDQGIEEIQLGGDPFHYFSGVPLQFVETQQWVEKKGYLKRIDTYDLINHLSKNYSMPEDNTVSYSILQPNEKEEFLTFLNKSFPGRWEYEAIKYFESSGSGREFVVLKKNGRIIGFCRINDDESPTIAQNVYWSPSFKTKVGGIGPLGVDSSEQKQGYGLGIVQAAMVILQERKVETIIIDWTILVDFYKKLDFDIWKGYGIYLKDLTGTK